MITDRADAEACLVAFANSGMDLRSWALAHGVDGRSLRAWQRRLAEPQSQAAEKASIRMVELVTGSEAATGAVVVRVGRCEIELRPGFDDETLRRILRVAQEC